MNLHVQSKSDMYVRIENIQGLTEEMRINCPDSVHTNKIKTPTNKQREHATAFPSSAYIAIVSSIFKGSESLVTKPGVFQFQKKQLY